MNFPSLRTATGLIAASLLTLAAGCGGGGGGGIGGIALLLSPTTPTMSRPPAFPVGCVFPSSIFAWTTTARPIMFPVAALSDSRSMSSSKRAAPSASVWITLPMSPMCLGVAGRSACDALAGL